MVSIGIYYGSGLWKFLWFFKIEILAGFLLGLSFFLYFYRKYLIRIEIKKLKEDVTILNNIRNKIILRTMSENERYTLKEVMSAMSSDFKEFKTEMRKDVKELVSTFHDYMTLTNERISKVEGNQKTTWKTISLYVGFFTGFVMLAISTYMSFVGK